MQSGFNHRQHWINSRKNSDMQERKHQSRVAGINYRYELKQCQMQEHLPIDERHTIASLPAIRPSSRPVERHTDEFNFNNLSLFALIDFAVCKYQADHEYTLPKTIRVSRSNYYLLALANYGKTYSNDYGEYRLKSDEKLDNSTIICENK